MLTMVKVESDGNILSDGLVRDTLGARISKAREQSGMSLTTVAKLAGIKRDTLKSWEGDASEPRASKVNMLAGILGVSVTYFLADEGHKGELGSDVASTEEMLSALQEQFRDLQESQQQIRIELDKIGQTLAKLG